MRCGTLLIVLFIVIVYAAIGTVVFHFLERDHEIEARQNVNSKIADFLANKSCVTELDFVKVKQLVDVMFVGGLNFDSDGTLINTTRWDLETSIFVGIELLATVGYSKAAPKTVGGRVFAICFSFIGIPFFILTIVGFGKLLNLIAELIIVTLAPKCHRHHSTDVDDDFPVDNKPRRRPPLSAQERFGRRRAVYRTLMIGVVGAVLFVFVPSAIFMQVEDWTYWEAVYYCIITLVTIGFGDFVPGYRPTTEWLSPGWYRLAVGCWIVIVIGWFAGVLSSVRGAIYEFALKAESKIVAAAMDIFTEPPRPRIQIKQTGSTSVVNILPGDQFYHQHQAPVKRLNNRLTPPKRSFAAKMRRGLSASGVNTGQGQVRHAVILDDDMVVVKPRLGKRQADLGYDPHGPNYSANIRISSKS